MTSAVVFCLLFCVLPTSLGSDEKLDSPDDTCPSDHQYIYHGGKEGTVNLDCGFQDLGINASQFAVCDVSGETLHILDLPICQQIKSIMLLTTNDSAEYDRGHQSGYSMRVPDVAPQRSAIEKYFRRQTWVLALEDGVVLVCGYMKHKYILKEGAISRCFGRHLDPNQFLIEQDTIQVGRAGQIFFYYYFVNNNDLSVQETLLVDGVMDPKPIFFKKTWYVSPLGGFYINCVGVTKGDIFDHSFLRHEWHFVEKSKYARCNGFNILIDQPRHGDTAWMIKPSLYVEGREGIVLDYFRNNSSSAPPIFVSAKDDMMMKCGSFTYSVRKNEVVSCNRLQFVSNGDKHNIIEGVEGVTYYYPLEIHSDVANNYNANHTDKYISLDFLNFGKHFGVQEGLVLRLVRTTLPEKDSKLTTLSKLSPETEVKLKYLTQQRVTWEAYT